VRGASRLAALALAALLSGSACTTWRGARLYESGTRALDRGDAEAAVADLERAAALVPGASEIQNHLGLAYAAAGRDPEAVEAFRRAVALDCDNQAARRNLRAASARPVLAEDGR
jgi:Flp pilus assembly protein TadD